MKAKEMRKKIHDILVKNDRDTYYLSAELALRIGIECITLKGKDDIQGMNFDEEYVKVKSEDLKRIYDEIRVEFEEVHLDELTEKQVEKLEREIDAGRVPGDRNWSDIYKRMNTYSRGNLEKIAYLN